MDPVGQPEYAKRRGVERRTTGMVREKLELQCDFVAGSAHNIAPVSGNEK